MTKREIERQNVALVCGIIENQFNGTVEDNGEGGRLDIVIKQGESFFLGQFSRRDLEVMLYDTTKLHNEAQFSIEMIQRRQSAVRLENQIQSAIEELFTK